jgi:hypothetical protein
MKSRADIIKAQELTEKEEIRQNIRKLFSANNSPEDIKKAFTKSMEFLK